MVTVVHFCKGFKRILNYNEQKVSEQVAVCLEAANYPKRVKDMTFTQKLKRLENLAALNDRATVNGVHISLNFDPSEQFSDDKLKEIVALYMDKVGFAEQPYLLYRHDDSGHPHVHIVSTNIRPNGKRIDTHDFGKIQSEKARKEIEQVYGLLRPEDSKNRQQYVVQPVNIQKAQYGRSATKRAIANVLNKILKEYKYSSLPELNAILQQYNIRADRGSTDSLIYQNHGLTYNIIDEKGAKLGVPIKASDFYSKPTLKFLEARFKENEALKLQKDKTIIKNAVDLVLLKPGNHTLKNLIEALRREGIQVVLRQNRDGIIYGLTYVDHKTKCVFNGSDLGKPYSANAIQERCRQQPGNRSEESTAAKEKSAEANRFKEQFTASGKLITDILLQPEYTGDTLPFDLKRKRKKKKKNISNNQ